jgi:hypothetical protein
MGRAPASGFMRIGAAGSDLFSGWHKKPLYLRVAGTLVILCAVILISGVK